MRASLSLLLLVPLAAAPAIAAPEPATDHWCGTGRTGIEERVAVHRDQQRRLERRRELEKSAPSLPDAVGVGDVAVVVDDGSIIAQPSLLDLDDFAMQYLPQKKGGYVVSRAADTVSGAIGTRLDLSDDDSRLVKFPRGFKFRFFNKVYPAMFVHSDGNLTFTAADAASSRRSLFRLLGGPPRIAPLFADLNPETVTGEGGVFVLASKTKVVVTWLDLPEFGTDNLNTFQVVLHRNGRIVFAYGGLDALQGVVGVAPGAGGPLQLLDYTANLPTGILKKAIAERFVAQRTFDELAVAQAFFREFADDYDHLVVWLDFAQSLGGAFAFELGVKNEILGIGEEVYDFTAEVGSKGRLRSFVQMGALSRYPEDPDQTFLGTNSTLDVLGQETGHRWLAFLHFIDDGGQRSDVLLGRDGSHWSFCHNSLASDMEGNEIREDGGGRFTTVAATERFSPLDQYAMGLIPAEAVPTFWYVADGCVNRSLAPDIGVGIQGRRQDVTVDQIIAAEGERVPAADRAPHGFNMAFVLVAEAGQFPSAETIAKLDRIRAAWEPYFGQATDGNGAVSTALKPRP